MPSQSLAFGVPCSVMLDLALVLLAVGVIAFHFWAERRTARDHAKERARLIDALVARNAAEYAGLRAVDDPPKPRTPRQAEDHEFQVGS